jgi:SAM-dependent methyltransferase
MSHAPLAPQSSSVSLLEPEANVASQDVSRDSTRPLFSPLQTPLDSANSRRALAADGSYSEVVARFDTAGVPDKYPCEFGRSWRERREVSCLRRFLATIPSGSSVLDLPCGTGRLTPLLAERGLQITGADSSPRMAELARANWIRRGPGRTAATAQFLVREGGATGFAEGAFDAIVCNRLFHHFREPSIRVAVLSEFRRICCGRIFVSFFNSFALNAVRFRMKHWLRGTTPTDRIPIPMTEFAADIHAAGLRVLSTSAVAWGFSPMWYVELCDANT